MRIGPPGGSGAGQLGTRHRRRSRYAPDDALIARSSHRLPRIQSRSGKLDGSGTRPGRPQDAGDRAGVTHPRPARRAAPGDGARRRPDPMSRASACWTAAVTLAPAAAGVRRCVHRGVRLRDDGRAVPIVRLRQHGDRRDRCFGCDHGSLRRRRGSAPGQGRHGNPLHADDERQDQELSHTCRPAARARRRPAFVRRASERRTSARRTSARLGYTGAAAGTGAADPSSTCVPAVTAPNLANRTLLTQVHGCSGTPRTTRDGLLVPVVRLAVCPCCTGRAVPALDVAQTPADPSRHSSAQYNGAGSCSIPAAPAGCRTHRSEELLALWFQPLSLVQSFSRQGNWLISNPTQEHGAAGLAVAAVLAAGGRDRSVVRLADRRRLGLLGLPAASRSFFRGAAAASALRARSAASFAALAARSFAWYSAARSLPTGPAGRPAGRAGSRSSALLTSTPTWAVRPCCWVSRSSPR